MRSVQPRHELRPRACRAAARISANHKYPQQSDPGPFPVPENAPIENWPLAHNEDQRALPGPVTTLATFQREGTGDRHLIIVDPVHKRLHEFWQARLTDEGWQASQASTFDLGSNAMRPDGWTSSDAAGLPIFPSIVRYDESRVDGSITPCA